MGWRNWEDRSTNSECNRLRGWTEIGSWGEKTKSQQYTRNMARPAKLTSTCGCESRQGKSNGGPVADPSARVKSLVPSGVTKAFSYKE